VTWELVREENKVTHDYTFEHSMQHTRMNAASKLLSDIEGGPNKLTGAWQSYMLRSGTYEGTRLKAFSSVSPITEA
jgi:hypothetical protein